MFFINKTVTEGVPLGAEVRDRVTGFQGIAIARRTYLNGCARLTVQPLVDDDGKMMEPVTFDEPRLEILDASKHPQRDTTTGGPEKYMPKSRPT